MLDSDCVEFNLKLKVKNKYDIMPTIGVCKQLTRTEVQDRLQQKAALHWIPVGITAYITTDLVSILSWWSRRSSWSW